MDLASPEVREGRGEEALQFPEQGGDPVEKIVLGKVLLTEGAAPEESTWEQVFFLKDCSPWRIPSWRRREQQRGAIMDWSQFMPDAPCHTAGLGRGVGGMEE